MFWEGEAITAAREAKKQYMKSPLPGAAQLRQRSHNSQAHVGRKKYMHTTLHTCTWQTATNVDHLLICVPSAQTKLCGTHTIQSHAKTKRTYRQSAALVTNTITTLKRNACGQPQRSSPVLIVGVVVVVSVSMAVVVLPVRCATHTRVPARAPAPRAGMGMACWSTRQVERGASALDKFGPYGAYGGEQGRVVACTVHVIESEGGRWGAL